MKRTTSLTMRTMESIAPRRYLVTHLLVKASGLTTVSSSTNLGSLLVYPRVCEGDMYETCKLVKKTHFRFLGITHANKMKEYWKKAHSDEVIEAIQKVHEKALQSVPGELKDSGKITILNREFESTLVWGDIYSSELGKFLIAFSVKHFERHVLPHINSQQGYVTAHFLPSYFKKMRYEFIDVDSITFPTFLVGLSRGGQNTLRLMVSLPRKSTFGDVCASVFAIPLALLSGVQHLDKKFFMKVYPFALKSLREQTNLLGKEKLWKEAKEYVNTHIRRLKSTRRMKEGRETYSERMLKTILFECFQTGAYKFYENLGRLSEMELGGGVSGATPFHVSNILSNVAPGVLGHLIDIRRTR